MLTKCIKYSTTSISDAVNGFLTLLPHQSINFFQHRLYYLVVPFLHDEMMNAEASFEILLSIRDCLIKSVFLVSGCSNPVDGMLIKSLCPGNLTRKDTINEINKGNHNCEGHKGTIIIALSTVSVFILDRILGIIVNDGNK